MIASIFEQYRPTFYSVPVLVVSLVTLAIGLFILSQNFRSSINNTFFLICFVVAIWLSGAGLLLGLKDPELGVWLYRHWTFLGVTLISSCVYTFSVAWFRLWHKQRFWVILSFAVSFGFYLAGWNPVFGITSVKPHFWGFHARYGLVSGIYLIPFFAYFFAAFYNFLHAYRMEEVKTRKIQIRLIAIAFTISFVGSVDYVSKLLDLSVYPFGYLCVFTWILMVAYSIVKHKAMDIETVIHKTLMWFVSTVFAVAPFAFSIYFSQEWLRNKNAVFSTGFTLVLMLLFYTYFRTIQPWLDRIFRSRMVNLNTVSNRFAAELVHLKSLRDLLQYTARVLRRTVFAETVSIYLKSNDTQEIYPAIAKKIRNLPAFSVSHPFLSWLEKQGRIVIPELAEGDPQFDAVKPAMVDYVSRVQAVVVVPFVLGDKLTGALHLGRKENLQSYTSQEIAFLGRIKSALTIAFSNSLHVMAMQENLRRWNEELEKKVEERTRQLQDTQAQLVQAEKLATIGTLAGGVAHEINNPLTAVLTNAQILKMSANPEDAESLDLIEEGAKRCQMIIQKLMKYARKSMGPETMGKVDLNKAVDNTVAFLDYQLRQENIELIVEKSVNLPLIEGNSNELEQVLMNLILNAKDAIKQSGRKGIINLRTHQTREFLNFSVKDNGVGIPKENLQKIFDPFFTTKELGKGTGLGLAVSFGIIEKHKGKIQVETEIGEGTEFLAAFPIVHG